MRKIIPFLFCFTNLFLLFFRQAEWQPGRQRHYFLRLSICSSVTKDVKTNERICC